MIELTKDQKKACEKIQEWYDLKIRPFFILSGYAGTGKTFTVDYVVNNYLKIDPELVAFVTPTGKAATVLIQKGRTQASTIHRLIYEANTIEEEQLIDGEWVLVEKVEFNLKKELDKPYKLIVVDEVSMVSREIFEDLLSFNIPILCSGDKGQLPPVQEGTNELLNNPDAELEEIVRQADGNSIIELANYVRHGNDLPYGDYGNVLVLREEDVNEEWLSKLMVEADQILCGKNTTRHALNNMYRQLKGIDTKELPRAGEKIISMQNDWEQPLGNSGEYNLVNGMIGYIEKDVEVGFNGDRKLSNISFKPEFLKHYTDNIIIDPGIFIKEYYHKPRASIRYQDMEYLNRLINEAQDYGDLRKASRRSYVQKQINRFEYGYAISVHKSQGSQFKNVLLFDESRVFGENRYKWLYTAITRAEENIIIIK